MTRPDFTTRSCRFSIALCLLALTACADDTPDLEPAPKQPSRMPGDPQPGPGEPSAEDPGGWLSAGADAGSPAVLATREINQAFWFTGWKVTLGTAQLEATEGDSWATLTLAAQFENLLDGSSRVFNSGYDDDLTLAVGGKYYQGSVEAPLVPSQRSGGGALMFSSLPRTIELDSATLLVGTPDYAQPKVPLGPKGERLVTLEPTVLALGQTMNAGDLIIHAQRVEVKANAGNTQKEAGTRRLRIDFAAEMIAKPKSFSINLVDSDFTLTRPDGNAVRGDNVNELLYAGDKLENLWVNFTVPEQFSGTYTLTVDPGYSSVPATSLTFTLP